MSINLYIATRSYVENLGDFHLTLAFMDIRQTSKLDLNLKTRCLYGKVISIEYWSHVNLTVAIVEIPAELHEIKKNLDDLGFTYNHEFKPHLTLRTGDFVDEFNWVVGNTVLFGNTYLRIKDF